MVYGEKKTSDASLASQGRGEGTKIYFQPKSPERHLLTDVAQCFSVNGITPITWKTAHQHSMASAPTNKYLKRYVYCAFTVSTPNQIEKSNVLFVQTSCGCIKQFHILYFSWKALDSGSLLNGGKGSTGGKLGVVAGGWEKVSSESVWMCQSVWKQDWKTDM